MNRVILPVPVAAHDEEVVRHILAKPCAGLLAFATMLLVGVASVVIAYFKTRGYHLSA